LLERLNGDRTTPKTKPSTRKQEEGIRESLVEEMSRLSGMDPDEISDDSHLYTDLGLDSLMAVELLLFLERNYHATLSEETVAKFQTVGDVLEELKRRGVGGDELDEAAPEPEEIRSALPYSKRPLIDRGVMSTSFYTMRTLFRRYFELQVENEQAVPASGAYILAANHSSHLDTAAIIAALSLTLGVREAQRIHVIGARDYFFNSMFKSWVFSNCLNVVPIERDEISLVGLRRITRILQQGEPVLIFPEGTRSRTGQLQAFKPGIGLVAWESKAPILPVYIKGSYEAMPPEKSMPSKKPIRVRFGDLMKIENYSRPEADSALDLTYRQIASDVRLEIENLINTANGADKNPY
jgi:long-chain acyl-CoA synthetase